MSEQNLVELVSNFPHLARVEISRDAIVRQIERSFSPQCQQQMIVGGPQTGKSNLLSQFAREYKERTVSYFITPNPLTQNQYAFLYSMCFQLSYVLTESTPPTNIALDSLKSLFIAQSIKLTELVREKDVRYYFLVDGLEWALVGEEGSRIIDIFPPHTAPLSPFLLFSCRSDSVGLLPERIACNCLEPWAWEFNRHDTKEYLKELNLTEKRVGEIHERCKGVPGYLKILKDALIANPEFELSKAPVELDKLIDQQIENALKTSEPATIKALELLAVSPVPLSIGILADLADTNEDSLLDRLKRTNLIRYLPELRRMEYVNGLTHDIFAKRLGKQYNMIARRLLEHLKMHAPQEELLIDILLIDLDDYPGLKNRLSVSSVLKTVENPAFGISAAIRRLRSASRMAQLHYDTTGLVRWTLGTATTKSFTSHMVNLSEIQALIAIEQVKEALSRAYALPDMSTKIRLLARIFASMKENRMRVPKDAHESLRSMVDSISIEDIDKEIAERIAVDLFPVLPDEALILLEKIVGQTERENLLEVAAEALFIDMQEQREDDLLSPSKKLAGLDYITRWHAKWFSNIPYSELVEGVLSSESTRVKEYIIRRWCRQNFENPEVVEAILLWLDIVISDKEYHVPLRSLRKISELVIEAPLTSRRKLIESLKIPGFMSIDTPKEEWIRFRLNLAEALHALEPDEAYKEIKEVFRIVFEEDLELDVKTFCHGRLLETTTRVIPNNPNIIGEMETYFQEGFYALLKDSADQFEITRGIIGTLADIDPARALIAASYLNTQQRRERGVQLVIQRALIKHGHKNQAGLIEDAIKQFDNSVRDIAIVRILDMLRMREVSLAQSNLLALLYLSRQIEDVDLRTQSLSNLVTLFGKEFYGLAIETSQEAISSWKKQQDLQVRLLGGYGLVESIAEIDVERAKEFYDEIQLLHLLPGAALAAGELGEVFKETLGIAIRALKLEDFKGTVNTASEIEAMIQRVPAEATRLELYAKLAGSAYRGGYAPYADEIVRTKIVAKVRDLPPGLDRDRVYRICLPVIFEYDPSEAKALGDNLSSSKRDMAWISVVYWILCRSFLGDHFIDPRKLKVSSDYRTLKKVLSSAASEIECDNRLIAVIEAIANSTRVSFDVILDQTQAFDILHKLDGLAASRLPDKKNIRHHGYLVIGQAISHGARSYVFRKLERAKRKSPRNVRRADINNGWKQICEDAERIPNLADRVFVMAIVSKKMADYYDKDRRPARAFLQKASDTAALIPTLNDRVVRFELIAKTWADLGEERRAVSTLEMAFELTDDLEGRNADRKLKKLVQTAYKFSPKLADELVTKLDKSRLPDADIHPAQIALQIETLISDPFKVQETEGTRYTQGTILGASTRSLLKDLASGRGTVRETSTLEQWLLESQKHRPRVSLDVVHWVVENLHRKQTGMARYDDLVGLVYVAELNHQLARKVSPVASVGIPDSLQSSFPGLNLEIVSFGPNEVERARKWLRSWLSKNARGYLWICDPYFGPDELDYLRYVPEDCKILVITTDAYISCEQGTTQLRNNLRAVWREISSRSLPKAQFMVVPRRLEGKFHDRAIVSSRAGLNLGPSLNGLGKSRGIVTVLNEVETNELAATYFKPMLDSATWFMDHGISPTVFYLGDTTAA